jgi:hypothetical protein
MNAGAMDPGFRQDDALIVMAGLVPAIHGLLSCLLLAVPLRQ